MTYIEFLEQKIIELERKLVVDRNWYRIQVEEHKDRMERMEVEIRQLQIQINVLVQYAKAAKARPNKLI